MRYRDDEKARLQHAIEHETYERNGAKIWKINDAPVPLHTFKDSGLTPPPAQAAEVERHTAEFLAKYRRNQQAPTDEERFEMCAAFGEGTTVVNVITVGGLDSNVSMGAGRATAARGRSPASSTSPSRAWAGPSRFSVKRTQVLRPLADRRPMSILDDAIRLATAMHADQTDKQGNPYILHPLRVMGSLAEAGEQRLWVLAVAVLHDVVEDTPIDLNGIEIEFGETVADAVNAVTRREGETYCEFVTRAVQHPVGRVVKLYDILDHVRPHRHTAEIEDIVRSRYLPVLRKTFGFSAAQVLEIWRDFLSAGRKKASSS